MKTLTIVSVILLQPVLFAITSYSAPVSIMATPSTTGQGFLFNDRYTCETTGGSPLTSDIDASAKKLDDIGDKHCQQKNLTGSRCTKMSDVGSAAIGICGTYNVWVTCRLAAHAAWVIQQQCVSNGRAGGTVWPEEGKTTKIIIYHN